MEKEELINNLKSKHILHYIFDYIKDKNFKDKLFLHSKKYQVKFDIKLVGLKENYLKKLNFDLDKYLFFESSSSEKDILTIEYNEFLIENNINKERLEKIVYDIFENKEIKDIEEEDVDKIRENEKLINIKSPLFKILSKTKNFGKIFTIYISQKEIDEYKDQYIQLFDKLNSLDINYASIFYDLKDINKINYLKEININFIKIKRLTIESDYYDEEDEGKNEDQDEYEDEDDDEYEDEDQNQDEYEYEDEDDDDDDEDEIKDEDKDKDEGKDKDKDEDKDKTKKNKIKNFFEVLFSINNIENNLIYLNVK